MSTEALHKREQSHAAARELPDQHKGKIKSPQEQDWALSTLGNVRNSDGQVSEKPISTLKMTLL